MPTDKDIAEWVVILTICLFVFFPYEMIYLSETSLGKLYFAVIIVYATTVDIAYGISACCAVILYYQMDLYRSFISLHRDTLLKEHMVELNDSLEDERVPSVESYVSGDSTVYSYVPFDVPANFYEDAILKNGEKNRELKEIFRKANCDDKGRLMHKGAPVRAEMSDHVFRELEFPGGQTAKCNPCSSECEFSVVESRISREDALVRPRSSNEPDSNDWVGHYIMAPINSIVEDAVAFKHKFAAYL